jgi:very-short-patch-repair endonuclease
MTKHEAQPPSPLEGEGRPKAGERGYDPSLLKHAKSMRANQTEFERKLWQYLRGHRFGGYKFRRQQPIANYIVDFVCQNQRLIVELDGSQHFEDRAVIYDANRTSALENCGYRILRFANHEIANDTQVVLDRIWHELTHPLPAAAQRPSP